MPGAHTPEPHAPEPLTPEALTAGAVRLRAVEADDVVRLQAWANDPVIQSEFNVFGPGPDGARFETQGGRLVVTAIGEDGRCDVIGDVSWRPMRHGPNRASQCWNIGITLVPAARGRGFGTTAQRLLCEHLFATTAAERIEADTDVENRREQRALEKAGFTREGVMRRAQWRAGAWHDMVLYSRLRGD